MGAEPGMMYTIYKGGEAVGWSDVQLSPEAVYLRWVYVNPEARGQGCRRKFVVALLEQASRSGVPVYIDYVDHLTDKSPTQYVTTDNTRSFYGEMGFKELFRYGSQNEKTRLIRCPDGTSMCSCDAPGSREYLIDDLTR